MTDTGKYDLILGIPWLEKHKPEVNWETRTLTFSQCRDHCDQGNVARVQCVSAATEETALNVSMVTVAEALTYDLDEDGFLCWQFPNDELRDQAMRANELHLAAVTVEDYDKFFQGKQFRDATKELIPELRHLAKAFDPDLAKELPPHRPEDMAIEFEKDAKLPFKRPYPMGVKELEVVKRYIDDMQPRGLIRPSTSRMASPVLLVKKPGGGLRVCVDYRAVNAITVKTDTL